jgi:hypothetical protein
MAAGGRLAQLSLAALRMAAAGRPHDHEIVARRLYRFGTHPRGPAVERDFGLDDEPMGVLGLTKGGRSRRCLEAAYEATTHPGWISFAQAASPAQAAPTCKLYVSPMPEALASAFPIIAETFASAGVRSFKVGRALEGLLRPDKIVAYFDDRAHLQAVALTLETRLLGCRPHGTPFTADAGGDGLLSWGVDPADWTAGPSWRSWITRRLAVALTTTKRADRVVAALEDIREAGVDPEQWAPTGSAFQ